MSVSEYFKKIKCLDELEFLKEHGIKPSCLRYGECDIAFPKDEEEYYALGGYSFMKVTAISIDAKELPIERAYFQLYQGRAVSLIGLEASVDDAPNFTNRIIETKDDDNNTYYQSFSFWAIPTAYFVDHNGYIAIDFKGGIKDFILLRGPWKKAEHIIEWVRSHMSKAKDDNMPVDYDVLSKFVQREFSK